MWLFLSRQPRRGRVSERRPARCSSGAPVSSCDAALDIFAFLGVNVAIFGGWNWTAVSYFWPLGWQHTSSSMDKCHYFFFPFLFTFESAATTDIDWVELFPPVKLRNICVDLKMSAEPTFTEWVINRRNINQVQRGEWQTAVIRHLWDVYLLNEVLLSIISSLFFFLNG